ncbi:MAG: PLP-dependent transferase, partial [Campylobacterales bacterium]|nr:PLP-dependent transferase [Campylobacterales bacterium]
MKESIFNFIPCGQTLPLNNIHAVSVSMPSLQDVIDYEEQTPQILEKIKSAYPRFVMHPYLKLLASHIKEKYKISNAYEVVLLSSQKAVEVVSNKYFIHNKIEINEPFGVILVQNGTTQLNKVLKFIQHVGYNLSSRLAEDYLFDIGLLKVKHQEELDDKEIAFDNVIFSLSSAYN